MQSPNHREAQRAFARQHFMEPMGRADIGFHIGHRQALLLHPELDGLDRIGWRHAMMLRFMRLHQDGLVRPGG